MRSLPQWWKPEQIGGKHQGSIRVSGSIISAWNWWRMDLCIWTMKLDNHKTKKKKSRGKWKLKEEKEKYLLFFLVKIFTYFILFNLSFILFETMCRVQGVWCVLVCNICSFSLLWWSCSGNWLWEGGVVEVGKAVVRGCKYLICYDSLKEVY